MSEAEVEGPGFEVPEAETMALSSQFQGLAVQERCGLLGTAIAPSRSLGCASVPASTSAPLGIRMAIKRWERKECKPNSLPVRQRMHVKVGDTVQVIAGKDKGKVSEVTRIFTHNSTVLLRDINIKTKHVKGKAEGEAGQIVQVEAPIHSSNVMLYSRAEKVASRVGHRILEDGSKVRYLIKTNEIIDKPEDWKRTAKKEKPSKPPPS